MLEFNLCGRQRCVKCDALRYASRFQVRNSKTGRTRLECVRCTSAADKARYAANSEAVNARVTARYRALSANARGERRAQQRSWESLNDERHHAAKLAYSRANALRLNAMSCARYAARGDEARLAKNTWRRSNAKRLAEHNRLMAKAARDRNPELAREKARLRRARRIGAQLHKFTSADLALRITAQGDACVYCGGAWRHVDHVKPLVRGGPHIMSNLRPACAACNLRKGSMPAHKWLVGVPRSAAMPLP